MQETQYYFSDEFARNPNSMLPSKMPEDIFDIVYVQSLDLLHAMSQEAKPHALNIDIITNIVADILRMHDIYDLYKENLTGLVVIYASWIVLESLKREKTVTFEDVGFDELFDNEKLKDMLIKHSHAFQKKLSTEIIKS